MTETERKKIEWLEKYGGINERIDRLELEIEKWRTRLEGVGAQLIDGMPRSHGNKKSWEKMILEVEKLDNELTQELLNLRKKRLAIIEAINTIQEPRLQVLIEHRYIDLWRWEKICEEMHITWNTVHRWHRNAIRQVKIKDGTQSHT